MFVTKFRTKCNRRFGGFLKIHNAFYKHVFNLSNANNANQNYLSIELLSNFLTTFFVEKTRLLSKLFSNSEFWMSVYEGKIEARSRCISLDTFLRISLRKINILKRTKLNPREFNEVVI